MKKITDNKANKPSSRILVHILTVAALLCLWATPFQTAYGQAGVERTVGGAITGSDGTPLVGATILVKGTNKGTTSDINGKYSVRVKTGDVITVSYLGYDPKNTTVGEGSEVNVSLQPNASEMETVIVIGYGSVKKTDLTGSVSNVKMSDIAAVPVMSVDQALQGRVAGADIMSTSGEPGAGTSIRIRGTRSITAGNEPLIIVDGVIDGVSNLNDINPADIQSVSVLKDASSTAIYGSRAANGVIIITTKQGRSGKPEVSFRADVGLSQLPRGLDLMNATEFAIFRNNHAFFNSEYGDVGEGTPLSEFPYKNPYSLGEGTDWVKEITRIAPFQNYNFSISGGTEKTVYFGSLGYTDNQGIIKNSGIKRYTGRFNLDHEFSKYLKVGTRLTYTYNDDNNSKATVGGTSYGTAAIFLAPTLKANDNFNEFLNNGQRFNSPIAHIQLRDDMTRKQTINNALYIEITPFDGFSIRSQASLYNTARHNFRYTPSNMPANTEGVGGTAYRGEFTENSLLSETTVTYVKEIEGHSFDVMGGATFQKWNSDDLTLQGSGYLVDGLKWNSMGSIPDKQNYSASTNNVSRVTNSVIFRANYNYKQRYYLTYTQRVDGSSNFAENNKYGFFPSGAVKWSIHNENFMKNATWLSELAVRLSAGKTGNDAIGSYVSLERMGSTTGGYLFDGAQPVAYYRNRLASPNLTWETTTMYTAAIDLSFLNGRINSTFEVYRSRTNDLLLNVQKPTQTGYSSILTNVGSTSNEGVELTVESRNIVKPNFTWSTSFTFSHNNQKVLNIGSEDRVEVYTSSISNHMMYGYVAGYPLNALWGYKYAGTWKNAEELARNEVTHAYASLSALQRSPGGPRYLDLDHNGTINQADIAYMGSSDPWLYGGIQNSFTYKKFSFGFYFNYSLGGKIYNVSELFMGNNSGSTNQYRYMLRSWHPVRNPDSDIPRGSTIDNLPNDRFIHDASFVRLKNASISYRFDMAKVTKNVIRDIVVSASGDNIYLWKRYNGFDPEVSTNSGDSALRRLDVGAYPKARTITFSLQLRY